MTLSETAKKTKISKTTANKVTKRLCEEGFLKIKEVGKSWLVSCNIHHIYNTTRKIIYNLSIIYDAYENVIRDSIYTYVTNPLSVVLFGSYRKGDDNEKSDIDIAVEVLGQNKMEIIEMGVFDVFGIRHKVTVNLHIFSRKNIDINLFSNIANGIVLDGFLEVKP
ncbi:MAG: nucleotidyltransferase domain-containing protein [Nanoarchaeota archaeon]|nr:nucleotidyltransferase domain-containing protein [Nanoarchaeota archaeon]